MNHSYFLLANDSTTMLTFFFSLNTRQLLPACITTERSSKTFMASASVTDVLIIGGSHAGLSAALTLYRALHTSVIFDTHKPRNWYSSPVRLTPTWDNQDPEKLREASREELRGSKLCHFVDAAVQRVKKLDNGLFQAIDAHSELWLGRKLLLAIGVEDDFPNLPGYKENYPARMCVPSPFLHCPLQPLPIIFSSACINISPSNESISLKLLLRVSQKFSLHVPIRL